VHLTISRELLAIRALACTGWTYQRGGVLELMGEVGNGCRSELACLAIKSRGVYISCVYPNVNIDRVRHSPWDDRTTPKRCNMFTV
jgi:hypothetical protein